MSEMVERVARDINEMIANLAHPVGMGLGLPEKAAKAIAVIAIHAMREPTLAQAKAGMDSDDLRTGFETCAHIYRAMIDAALLPPPATEAD